MLLNAQTGGRYELNVTALSATVTPAGTFNLPSVDSENGSAQWSDSHMVFTGDGGDTIVMDKTHPAAFISLQGYYDRTGIGQANICSSGALTLSQASGYGIPAQLYAGIAYLDDSGLKYAIKSIVSIGGDQIYTGNLSVDASQAVFSLPGGNLTLPRMTGVGASLAACS